MQRLKLQISRFARHLRRPNQVVPEYLASAL